MTTLQEGAQRIASQLLATINTVHATGKWPVNTLPLMREAAQALVNEPQAEPATGKESLTPQQAQQAQGVPAGWSDAIAELLTHIEDVVPDDVWPNISVPVWNRVSALLAPQAEPQPEREPLTEELLLAAQSAITCSYADHGRRSVNSLAWDRLMAAVAAVSHGIGTKGGGAK